MTAIWCQLGITSIGRSFLPAAPSHCSLIVLELYFLKVSETDEEVEGKISVRSFYEGKGGPPAM